MSSHPLYRLLDALDQAHNHYTLSRTMPGAILVSVTFVGERTEVQIYEDGQVEVSRFRGDESLDGGEELIYQLLELNQDNDA